MLDLNGVFFIISLYVGLFCGVYKIKGGNGMSDKCELLDTCGFFLNFKGNSEVIKQGWIRSFCESRVKSERCERKKIRAQTGQPPVDNMTPTGKLL